MCLRVGNKDRLLYTLVVNIKIIYCKHNVKMYIYFDVAHSIGVQNVVLPFFCLQEPVFNVLIIFFVLKLGVYACLVMSLLILSLYLSKQLKESSRTQNLGVKRL